MNDAAVLTTVVNDSTTWSVLSACDAACTGNTNMRQNKDNNDKISLPLEGKEYRGLDTI